MNEQIRNRIAEINQGKVPEGYKKKSLGVIPEEWEDKTLNDIGDFYKGKGIPRNELQYDGVPCIGYGDIYMKYNYHFEKAVNFVDPKTADESQPIQKGTLLFTGSGETAEEIGKCVCYNGEETIYAGGDIILYKSEANPLFISYQQSIEPSIKAKAKLAQGHSVVHIYADRLGKLSAAYPEDKQEQQKIAEILMKWDEAIALQEKLIEKLEVQKKALMQRLLRPKDDWDKFPLDKILTESAEKTNFINQYPVVSSTKEGLFLQSEYFDKEIASQDNIGYKVIRINQIILSPQNLWMGNINYNERFDIGMVSPSYKVFSINEGFNSKFISTIMLSPKMFDEYSNISEQGASIVRRNLSIDLFKRIEIFVPDIITQNYIANITSCFENGMTVQMQKLTAMKLQQKSLMQLLLTGIVRV